MNTSQQINDLDQWYELATLGAKIAKYDNRPQIKSEYMWLYTFIVAAIEDVDRDDPAQIKSTHAAIKQLMPEAKSVAQSLITYRIAQIGTPK